MSSTSAPSSAEAPRDLLLGKVNVSVATTPLPATSLQAFVPFYTQPKHQPFIARNAWRTAINGIRALRRLKGGGSGSGNGAGAKGGVEKSSPAGDAPTPRSGDGPAPLPLRSDLVVASGHQGRVLLWNADALTPLGSTAQHGGGTVTQLVVTNTRIVSIIERDPSFRGVGGGGNDAEVMLWDMVTMTLEATLAGHDERVTCVAVSSEDENHLLTGSNDRTILEWLLPSQVPVARYVGHTSAVTQLCFVFGRYFMSGGHDSTLKVWASDVKAKARAPLSATQRPPRNNAKGLERHPSMRLGDGGLLRTDSAKALRLAAVREGTALHTVEGHMGAVSYLENMSEEGSISMKRPSSASSRLAKALSDSATRRTVSIVSACNGGIVRCVSLTFEVPSAGDSSEEGAATTPLAASGSSLSHPFPKTSFALTGPPEAQWLNKSHRALVKDVCWDGHVIVSASLSDGLSFFNTDARVSNKVSLGGGVRHLAIDTMRRLVVAGCESGQLAFYSYDGFYALGQYDHYSYQSRKEGTSDDSVLLVASYQPHAGNITGMLLERSINGQWERLITTSSDSTFFVMDFDTHRDSRSFPMGAGGAVGGAPMPSGPDAHHGSLSRRRSSSVLGAVRASSFKGALPPSLTPAQSIANRLTPIAACGSFLLASGPGASTWDIAGMIRRCGDGKSVGTVSDLMEGNTTSAPSHMAGSAAKALSRQSTPPPGSAHPPTATGPAITCCAYYPSLRKAAVGLEGGQLRVHPVGIAAKGSEPSGNARPPLDLDGPGSPPRTFANPNDHTRSANVTPKPASFDGAASTSQFPQDEALLGDVEEFIRPPARPSIAFEPSMYVRMLSTECVGGVVACCLERAQGPSAHRNGGIVLVDLATERQVTSTYPLDYVPIAVKLFGYTNKGAAAAGADDGANRTNSKSDAAATQYIILVQLRNGQIILLTGSSGGEALSLQRTVLKEQVPYYPDREAEGLLPMPPPMFASLDAAYSPPRVNVMAVEKGILRSMVVPPVPPNAPGGDTVHRCALPFFEMVNVSANLAAAIPVVAWAPMRLSGYLAAVALDNGTVTLVSEAIEADGHKLPPNATPDVLREYRPIDIFHSGAVADHVRERTMRRQRRCFVKMGEGGSAEDPTGVMSGASSSSSSSAAVRCTVMSVSPHARLLALGYSDGTVQLWDFATRRVVRRICAHAGRPILHVALFSREHRLLSLSDGEMRFDTLYGRNVTEPRRIVGSADEPSAAASSVSSSATA